MKKQIIEPCRRVNKEVKETIDTQIKFLLSDKDTIKVVEHVLILESLQQRKGTDIDQTKLFEFVEMLRKYALEE